MNTIPIVLMGSGGNSWGCGVLMSYKSQKYIVSVGHVARAILESGKRTWAIPNIQKTHHPLPSGYANIGITEVFLDNSGTDIAVMPIDNSVPVNCIKLDPNNFAILRPGDKIACIGYPTEYLLPQLHQELNEPCYPLEITGMVTDMQLDFLTDHEAKEKMPVRDQLVAKMDSPNIDHSGNSGALVISDNGKLAGVLTGGSRTKGIIVFAPFSLVIQYIDSLQWMNKN